MNVPSSDERDLPFLIGLDDGAAVRYHTMLSSRLLGDALTTDVDLLNNPAPRRTSSMCGGGQPPC